MAREFGARPTSAATCGRATIPVCVDCIYVPASLPNQLIDAAKLVISAPCDDARHYGPSPHGVHLTVGIMSRPLMTGAESTNVHQTRAASFPF